MNRTQALQLLDIVSNSSTYYKDLDITTQLTQLNALKKCSDLSLGRQDTLLLQVKDREKRLAICLEILCVLDEPLSDLQYVMSSFDE